MARDTGIQEIINLLGAQNDSAGVVIDIDGSGLATLTEQEAQTALLGAISTDSGTIQSDLTALRQFYRIDNLTQYIETQLTAPGSTTWRGMSKMFARFVYTVANINTNVVIRAEGRMHSSSNTFNLNTGDITITANGTYPIFIDTPVTEIRFTFVSESGGTAATIDVETYA